MLIIDSIYESSGAFSIKVRDTNNYILMRGGEVDTVALVTDHSEMYNEHLDCKVFTYQLKLLSKACEGLGIGGIVCAEYLDKHVIIKLNTLQNINKLNPNYLKSEYEFIKKENMREIKGGLYKVDKEMLEKLN